MDHCSFTDPRKTEGWVGLVGWPIADTLPMKWSHVNHIIIEDYKTERNFDGMFSEERFDNFAENQIGRPKISTKHLTISLRKKHVFRKRLPHTWVRMHSTAPTKYLHQCVTTAFRWQEDADCPPNIQLFRRQDFCGCCSKRLEQFAVGLNEKPICHTPGSGGCRKHFIWTARPRRIVDGINCAVWKYFYLLTYLLTYHARFCFEKKTRQMIANWHRPAKSWLCRCWSVPRTFGPPEPLPLLWSRRRWSDLSPDFLPPTPKAHTPLLHIRLRARCMNVT